MICTQHTIQNLYAHAPNSTNYANMRRYNKLEKKVCCKTLCKTKFYLTHETEKNKQTSKGWELFFQLSLVNVLCVFGFCFSFTFHSLLFYVPICFHLVAVQLGRCMSDDSILCIFIIYLFVLSLLLMLYVRECIYMFMMMDALFE